MAFPVIMPVTPHRARGKSCFTSSISEIPPDAITGTSTARAKAVVKVEKDKKNEKYHNFYFNEVIQALNLDGLEEEEAPEEPEEESERIGDAEMIH